jgi:hypothetical protein
MGIGGKTFDWLCMLYRRMEYYVRHGDMNSAEFKAFIGLLTGDPASPVLWNLFMAVINMVKTVIIIFGPVAQPLPPFHLGSTVLNLTIHAKYVGVHIRTDTRDMFEFHYREKANTAALLVHVLGILFLLVRFGQGR